MAVAKVYSYMRRDLRFEAPKATERGALSGTAVPARTWVAAKGRGPYAWQQLGKAMTQEITHGK